MGGRSARHAAYSLARMLGLWDVDAMLETMSVPQFNEWIAFIHLENETQAPREGAQRAPASAPDPDLNAKLLGAFRAYQVRQDKK